MKTQGKLVLSTWLSSYYFCYFFTNILPTCEQIPELVPGYLEVYYLWKTNLHIVLVCKYIVCVGSTVHRKSNYKGKKVNYLAMVKSTKLTILFNLSQKNSKVENEKQTNTLIGLYHILSFRLCFIWMKILSNNYHPKCSIWNLVV